MKYSPRRSGGWLESACSNCRFNDVAETTNFTAESARITVRGSKAKRIFEAGSVRHSSTNFFVVWKSSG
jgi:hypothetical protein